MVGTQIVSRSPRGWISNHFIWWSGQHNSSVQNISQTLSSSSKSSSFNRVKILSRFIYVLDSRSSTISDCTYQCELISLEPMSLGINVSFYMRWHDSLSISLLVIPPCRTQINALDYSFSKYILGRILIYSDIPRTCCWDQLIFRQCLSLWIKAESVILVGGKLLLDGLGS